MRAYADSKEQAGLVKMARMLVHAQESRRESCINKQMGNPNLTSETGLILVTSEVSETH